MYTMVYLMVVLMAWNRKMSNDPYTGNQKIQALKSSAPYSVSNSPSQPLVYFPIPQSSLSFSSYFASNNIMFLLPLLFLVLLPPNNLILPQSWSKPTTSPRRVPSRLLAFGEMSDFLVVALIWDGCVMEGRLRFLGRIKGLNDVEANLPFFVCRVEGEWGFDVLVSPDLSG